MRAPHSTISNSARMDTRRYEQRRRRLYIDVLRIPDISEAVDRAREQLRANMMKAMAMNMCDEEGNIIENNSKAKAKAKAKSKEKPKGPTDSHELYSILTTRSMKENQLKVAKMKQARERGESVELALNPKPLPPIPSIKQKKKSRLLATNTSTPDGSDSNAPVSAAQALVSNAGMISEISMEKSKSLPSLSGSKVAPAKPKPVVHSWKSTAKAGPGILSKRPRPESSNDNASAAAQPASKRAAPTTLASIIQIAANEAVPKPAPSKPQQSGPKRSATFIANSSKIAALRAKEARSKAIDNSNYAHTRKAVPKPSATRSLLDMKSSSKSTSATASRIAPARPLPAAVRAPVTKLVPLNRGSSAVSRTVVEAGHRTAAHTIARRSASSDGLPRSTLGGSGRSLLPMTPSLAGRSRPNLGVLFPPGIDAIGTVKPNGYQITANGLKPVVTPDHKVPPKVPLKLRQTAAEKLFAAWRDKQKMAEMDALVRALREEQRMFASAAGKSDYRASSIAQLISANKVDEKNGAAATSNSGGKNTR